MTFNYFSKTFSQRHNHIAMTVLKISTRKSKCQGGQKIWDVLPANHSCSPSVHLKKKKIRSLQSG